MTADGRCLWLYAVAAGDPGPPGGDVTGVGGGQVRVVRAAGLTAIVEDVSQLEFGAAALRRNLEDLDWLDRAARAHHMVISAAAGRGPVVPMRLATVYSRDESVTGTLRERAADLYEALGRLRARSEWGVKAYAAEPDPSSADPADPAASQGHRPGAAYLQRRRTQLAASKNLLATATASARIVHAELERVSVSARLYPPQPARLAGQRATMVMNAAYLVADERADEFAVAVTGLTARHQDVRLTLTGPWPAYSFVGVSDAVTGDG
jgi:hypothetical protein